MVGTKKPLLEYIRAFFWLPTDLTREALVYSAPLPGKRVEVRERQRLFYGRWGRFKWRTEKRYATLKNLKLR